MTVEQIIEAVRFCYDEEKMDGAAFSNASNNDNTYMDNIIKSRIGDAVRWICLYAPAELLGGTDEILPAGTVVDGSTIAQETAYATGILVDATASNITEITAGGGRFALPKDFIKLSRVRVYGEEKDWHRAVKEPLSEDSEEYLQLYDDNGAKATYDRPQAAIIDKSIKEMEVWPWAKASADPVRAADTINYTYVADVNPSDSMIEVRTGSGTTADPYVYVPHYPLPPRVKTAFIYYLAFLTLSAYEDSRAARMLEIAKMNLGLTDDRQRA